MLLAKIELRLRRTHLPGVRIQENTLDWASLDQVLVSNLRWLHKCSHTPCSSLTDYTCNKLTQGTPRRRFHFHSLSLTPRPSTSLLNPVFQRMEHLIFFLPPFLSFLPPLSAPTSFFRARISRIRSKKTCGKHRSVLEELNHNMNNSDLENIQLRVHVRKGPYLGNW